MKRCIKSTRSVIVFKTASKEPGRRNGGQGEIKSNTRQAELDYDTYYI